MLSRFRALKFSGNLSARRLSNTAAKKKTEKLASEQLDDNDEDYFRFELKMMYLDIAEEKRWKMAVAKELAQVRRFVIPFFFLYLMSGSLIVIVL
jgi:hypothetical protein